MPWKECSVTDERMQFVARRLAGEPMAELCREFGISRKTGYKTFDAMAVFEQILLGSGLTTREVARPLTRKYSGGRTYNFRVARHSGADELASP